MWDRKKGKKKPLSVTKAMGLTKRKVTLKLMEDVVSRKACFKKRLSGLLKKMDELRKLCNIDACAIIFGPGDTGPTLWPSPLVARQLLDRFEEVPEVDRFRNMVDQQTYMLKKTKKIEDQLGRLKQRNEEKEMSIFMHQIYHDGKSLSDFDPSELKRLLCYVEEKLKIVRKKISHFEEVSPRPPPPPTSRPLHNGTDSRINKDDLQLPNQQSFLDLEMLPPSNFGGLIGGNDSGSGVSFQDNIVGGLTGGINDPGSGTFLPPGNFGGLNCEGDHFGSKMLPQGNSGGLNGENGHSGQLPQGNFRGLNGESGDHSQVFPKGDFGALDVESDSMVLPQGNFMSLNGESNAGLLYGSPIGGSDMTSLSPNSFEENTNGTKMGMQQHYENQGGSIDNKGLWCHQNNFGGADNTNIGTDMGRFRANFVNINKVKNLNPELPSHGDLACSSDHEGRDIEMPISLEEFFSWK